MANNIPTTFSKINIPREIISRKPTRLSLAVSAMKQTEFK